MGAKKRLLQQINTIHSRNELLTSKTKYFDDILDLLFFMTQTTSRLEWTREEKKENFKGKTNRRGQKWERGHLKLVQTQQNYVVNNFFFQCDSYYYY